MVINPRGLRKYVRNDTFFQSIPLILSRHPTVHFLCTGTQGNAQVEHWVDQLDIKGNVRLLPTVPHNDMGELFRASMIMVSPSEHDGTPNTLLEAMACGSFPVTGDIESVREWIRPEINGLLFDPSNPAEIADAVVRALERPDLRASAQKTNADLIRERAEYRQVMAQAEAFYRVLIQDVR
jgi:glycosyltransferase involved in cell wall biosynthesis